MYNVFVKPIGEDGIASSLPQTPLDRLPNLFVGTIKDEVIDFLVEKFFSAFRRSIQNPNSLECSITYAMLTALNIDKSLPVDDVFIIRKLYGRTLILEKV